MMGRIINNDANNKPEQKSFLQNILQQVEEREHEYQQEVTATTNTMQVDGTDPSLFRFLDSIQKSSPSDIAEARKNPYSATQYLGR